MTEYAIQAQNVVKKFGDFTAINNITLNVPKGSIYGFLGPNGCGKSTTIRVLTGLLSPSEGSVDVLGLEIPKQSEQLRLKIGYMTQKFSLYDDLSVQENLEFIGQIFGLSSQSLKERIEEQLTTYGLDQLRKQRVSGMSGGQKPVSYSHPPTPTIYSVVISAVAGLLKKKNRNKEHGQHAHALSM